MFTFFILNLPFFFSFLTLSGFSSGASTLHSLTMAHSGPVFGLSCHQAAGTLDFSDLFLTASADWSIKLWSTKYNTGSSISTLSSGKENAASTNSASNSSIIPSIHAFENNQDYGECFKMKKNIEMMESRPLNGCFFLLKTILKTLLFSCTTSHGVLPIQQYSFAATAKPTLIY